MLAVLAFAATLSWFAYDEYRLAIESEFHALESNARIGEAQVSGLLRNLDQFLNNIAHEQRSLPPAQRQAYDEVLAERKKQFPEIRSLVVIDAQGRVELTATPKLKGFDSSKRDYFVAHLGQVLTPNFYVSRTFKTATGNDIGIAFSIALRDDTQKFQGMVVAGIDPKYFETVLHQVLPQGNGTVATLFNHHGDLIYRAPNPEKFKNVNVATSGIFKAHIAAKQPITRHIGVSVADGHKRIYAIARVGATGISIGASRLFDDVLTPWRRHAVIRLSVFLLVSVILIRLGFIAQRRQREHELAEREILANEQRFRSYFNLPLVGLAITSLEKGWIEVNSRLCEMLGYAREDLVRLTWVDLTHPDDIAADNAEFERIVRGEIEGYSMEKRFIRQDGSTVYAAMAAHCVRKDNGRIDYFVAVVQDISERKSAEDQLRIAAATFESQEGMVVTNAAGTILRVNNAFVASTGYTAADAVGKNPRILKSGRHDAEFYREMWESIGRTGGWQGEIWDKRKDGGIFPKWLTISAVKNDAGVVTHYIGTHYDITERKKAEEKIRELAFFDQLTGLPNRTLLLDRLMQAMTAGVRNGNYGALLFIDLDNFKTLNDTLGHDMGDLLLKQVAQRLTTCVRAEDTVARLGGDEFVVMLSSLGPLESDAAGQTETVGEKILATLNRSYALNGVAYRNTPSIGAALFRGCLASVDDLMKQADLAMYKSKAAGRNALRFFDPDMEAVVMKQAALETDLRTAIDRKQFLLHYQGQVAAMGRVTGAEALVRWRHPQRGMVSPAEFIPLAEETRLILPLGQWVLETACAQLAAWAMRPKLAHLTIAVNVSAHQFREPDFVDKVVATIARTGANPQRLKLELTESLLVDKVEDIIAKMHALKTEGVGFALDDFGTGYSSLSYLKRLPLDVLKIDQSFVRDLLIDPNDATIARTIVALAQNLGLGVIAEGVETAAQRDCLASSGCEAYQGYFFTRPLPVEAFEAWVLNAR